MDHRQEEDDSLPFGKKRITRRKAISAGAGVAAGVVAGLVIGGASGYLAGGAGAGGSTKTVTQTSTVNGGQTTVTSTVGGGGGQTVTQTQTQTQVVTSTVQQGSKPYAGMTINTLLLSGPSADSVTGLAPIIKDRLGITLNITTYPIDTYYSKVQSELLAGPSTYDFVWMDTTEMPTLAQVGVIQSIDDLIQRDVGELPPLEQYNPAQRSYSTYQGKTYGWYYSVNFNEGWVRKDLFTDPKEQADFEKQYGYPLINFLQQPDWLMFNDVIQFFHRPPDLYGYTSPMTWPFLSIPAWHSRWYTCTGKPEIDENWEPWFDKMGDQGLLSLELLKYQQKFMPPGVLSMSFPEALAVYLQGKAAVVLGYDLFDLFKLEDSASTNLVGKSVQIPPIGGPIGWATYTNLGQSLGITAAVKDTKREAAWACIKVITDPNLEAYRVSHGQQTPASSWGWQKFAQLNPQYADDLKYISQYVAHSAGVAYGPFLDALVNLYQSTVAAAGAGQLDSQTALKNLADGFRTTYQPYTSKGVKNTVNADIPPWTGPDYTAKLKSQIGM